MTVLVPFSNAANIGLRRVTKDREISRILSFLSNGSCAINPDWKVRFKENTDKMQSGDLLRAAEVFKGLLQLHVDKPLSFREKKMLDRARHMLVSESLDFAQRAGDHRDGAVAAGAGQGGTDASGSAVTLGSFGLRRRISKRRVKMV